MKGMFKWLALGLVMLLAGLALTASWYLRWDEIPPPEMPGQTVGGVLEHDGLQRSWLAYVPASLAPEPDLLIVFHGSMSSGAMARTGTYYSFDVLAERNGFVALYPDGFDRHWNGCRATANYQANLGDVDDVGFVRQLVAEASRRFGVDPGRVFVAGISNGGHMVYRLAMEAPELIAAGAAVIANLPVDSNLGCQPSGRPVAMLILNGTEDPINPYGGGTVSILGDASRGEVRSAVDSAHYWAALAGHDGPGQRERLPQAQPADTTSLERLSWSGAGGPTVELISVLGGGHTFPHPVYNAPRALGPTSHQADGAELIWAFFSRH